MDKKAAIMDDSVFDIILVSIFLAIVIGTILFLFRNKISAWVSYLMGIF